MPVSSSWMRKPSIIFCFRAKEKMKLVKTNGKTEPVELGWQAIAGEEFVYEMTDRFLLLPGANGVPAFDPESMKTGVPKMPEEHAAIIGTGNRLDEEMGAGLARWAMGGAKAERPPRTQKHANMIADFEVVAREQGFDAFLSSWEGLSREDKAAIGRSERDRIGAIGRETDEARDPANAGADS